MSTLILGWFMFLVWAFVGFIMLSRGDTNGNVAIIIAAVIIVETAVLQVRKDSTE